MQLIKDFATAQERTTVTNREYYRIFRKFYNELEELAAINGWFNKLVFRLAKMPAIFWI